MYTLGVVLCRIKYVTAIFCYLSTVIHCRINPHVDIPIWLYPYAGNENGIFAYYFHLFMVDDLQKHHLGKMIPEDQETTSLLHLFVKFKVI